MSSTMSSGSRIKPDDYLTIFKIRVPDKIRLENAVLLFDCTISFENLFEYHVVSNESPEKLVELWSYLKEMGVVR